jgi:chromate transporter
MIYLQLFWTFFKIGLLSIGGGYAAMPLIQNQVVELNQWLSLTQFTDLITIAEVTPGPIAINAATFVGIQVAGIYGAIVATIGCIFPSSVIVLTLAYFYYGYKEMAVAQAVLQGIRPAVISFIASAGLSVLLLSIFGLNISLSEINYVSIGLFTICLILIRKTSINPICIIVGAGAIGLIIYEYII